MTFLQILFMILGMASFTGALFYIATRIVMWADTRASKDDVSTLRYRVDDLEKRLEGQKDG